MKLTDPRLSIQTPYTKRVFGTQTNPSDWVKTNNPEFFDEWQLEIHHKKLGHIIIQVWLGEDGNFKCHIAIPNRKRLQPFLSAITINSAKREALNKLHDIIRDMR